jgi:hypothetical protein
MNSLGNSTGRTGSQHQENPEELVTAGYGGFPVTPLAFPHLDLAPMAPPMIPSQVLPATAVGRWNTATTTPALPCACLGTRQPTAPLNPTRPPRMTRHGPERSTCGGSPGGKLRRVLWSWPSSHQLSQ